MSKCWHAQPLLDLGDIGVVFERSAYSLGAQHVQAKPGDVHVVVDLSSVLGQGSANAIWRGGLAGTAGVVADRLEPI